MELSKEKILDKIKVINLFRFAKRLELNDNPKEAFASFEKSLLDTWDLLTGSEKKSLEDLHLTLKKKYLNKVSSEKEQLFGTSYIENNEAEFSQAEIEKQILDLARNMKQVAGNFTNTLKQDESLLESISTNQSSYLTQLKKESERMASIQVKTNYFAFFRTFFAVSFSLVLFVIVLVIIYLFPSTRYITISN